MRKRSSACSGLSGSSFWPRAALAERQPCSDLELCAGAGWQRREWRRRRLRRRRTLSASPARSSGRSGRPPASAAARGCTDAQRSARAPRPGLAAEQPLRSAGRRPAGKAALGGAAAARPEAGDRAPRACTRRARGPRAMRGDGSRSAPAGSASGIRRTPRHDAVGRRRAPFRRLREFAGGWSSRISRTSSSAASSSEPRTRHSMRSSASSAASTEGRCRSLRK